MSVWLTTLYYLPGHGGRLETGLGEALRNRGWAVAGRETVGEFRTLRFQDQVDTVTQDLTQHFWHDDAQVVCNSFGAYLFLHAQAQMAPFPGRVLLLSPIVGEFEDHEKLMGFRPPKADRLLQLVSSGQYTPPTTCEIHVGALDWQSIPANVLALAKPLGIPVTVVPDLGHMLGSEYVGPLLDRWLKAP